MVRRTNDNADPSKGNTDYDELQRRVSDLNASRRRSPNEIPETGDVDSDKPSAVDGILDKVIKVSKSANGTDPSSTNPVVENAITVLEQLAEIGKVMPFVAPAFVILKVIIDVEHRAREADAKCNDLLERITFMLGLLPALNGVQVMDSTKQVIERMNSILKTAASLVQAYRKQGAVARRLNVNSRDKFASCASAITACSNDLMISLQIHQSGLLDILSRSVPVDPEDSKAQLFLDRHGGEDAVRADRSLVTQFANQMQLTVDDNVMDQLNTNISSLMQQNQVQLEKMITENVGVAVVDGLKELAAMIHEQEKEQTFHCVQCDKDFRMSTNSPTACKYHKAAYDSQVKNYPCCGESAPCQLNSHRSAHHCDYPYGLFFPRAFQVVNYSSTDTVDQWAEALDTNLEDIRKNQKASIGRLLRWVSKGDLISEPTILITAGRIWHTEKYFFHTFTVKEMELAAQDVSTTKQTTIFRSSPDDTEYTMIEWVLSSEGLITGVRLTAKAATSETPCVRLCPIDIATCTKSGDVILISDGIIRSFKPTTPYELPKLMRISPDIPKTPIRKPRTDFKMRTTPNLPLILKSLGEPALKANPDYANTNFDFFVGSISVFNKPRPDLAGPITIASVSAFYRLVGDKEYKPVQAFKIKSHQQLPVTIDPRESWPMTFEVEVPRTEEDKKRTRRQWWNHSFVARQRPLRLKVVLKDIEDEEASLVLEYVFVGSPHAQREETDLGFACFDDLGFWERYHVRVVKCDDDWRGVLGIKGDDMAYYMDVKQLERFVFKAIKTGETEIVIREPLEKDRFWNWGAWALVDISCRRVYAFKILLFEGSLVSRKTKACLAYVACPEYGDYMDESRPIKYADEKVRFPELDSPLEPQEVTTDDDFDDFDDEVVPEPSTNGNNGKNNSTPSGGDRPPQFGMPSGLSQRLASIDRNLASIDANLARLATTGEQLFAYLKTPNFNAPGRFGR